ncbi:NAD-dependent epimerase/dehydratase family protein [Nitrospira sp. Nam80]
MRKRLLITGGAGFVGSSLALLFRRSYPDWRIVSFDNLRRRGSELNLHRLTQAGIEFCHGDIRNRSDLDGIGKVDIIIECSAEPSALAGFDGDASYVIDTNLVGTVNCLELARRHDAEVMFLSTSRVYPYESLNSVPYRELSTRFEWEGSHLAGMSDHGVTEDFPLEGARTLYGATKLCAELLIREYVAMYGLRAVVNRCGVLTGPWQMGKVDQGFAVLWVARHHFGGALSYFGFGGQGKQVRDLLHVEDLFELIQLQVANMPAHSGLIYNVGGGRDCSVSLMELTGLCRQATGKTIAVGTVEATRPGDVRIYVADSSRVRAAAGWKPRWTIERIIENIAAWVRDHEQQVEPILGVPK